MHITPKRIGINPPEIGFDLKGSAAPSAIVTLTNDSREEAFLFRVRTTNPKGYLVMPNQEVIMPNSSVTVTIQMQADELHKILNSAVKTQVLNQDKFMITYMIANDSTQKCLTSAKEDGRSTFQTMCAHVWATTGKDKTANRRIDVHLVLPETFSHAAAMIAPDQHASSVPTTIGSDQHAPAQNRMNCFPYFLRRPQKSKE